MIFLENSGGCFVTKVSPDGSAARTGGVEVGDQLAAINGASSIKMKVDVICEMITKAPDTKCVELVFLRYIGAFRPSRKSRPESSFEGEAPGSPGSPHGSCELRATKKKTVSSQQALTPTQGKPKKSFRLFGRGKKKASKGK